MKKLIRNPFFIVAVLVILFAITALIIYLATKKKSPIVATTTPTLSDASSPPITTTSGTPKPPVLTTADREIIMLSSPYQKSSKIRRLQKALNDRGHDLTVDGVYGNLTHQAALSSYPNFLSDNQISPEELTIILDTSSQYDSATSWIRPAISKTGESIASIVTNTPVDPNYNAAADAQTIKDAFSWFNDDEEAVKKVFYRLTKSQIASLLVYFQAQYKESMDDFLKGSLLSGLSDTEYDEVLSIVRSRV